MFVQTLLGPLKYGLQVHCCTTFIDFVKKGVQLEKALIDKGELKYGAKHTSTSLPTDRNKYQVKNKHITNDGVVDAKAINTMGPILTLKGASPQNTQMTIPTPIVNAIQNIYNNQNNQNQGKP